MSNENNSGFFKSVGDFFMCIILTAAYIYVLVLVMGGWEPIPFGQSGLVMNGFEGLYAKLGESQATGLSILLVIPFAIRYFKRQARANALKAKQFTQEKYAVASEKVSGMIPQRKVKN